MKRGRFQQHIKRGSCVVTIWAARKGCSNLCSFPDWQVVGVTHKPLRRAA